MRHIARSLSQRVLIDVIMEAYRNLPDQEKVEGVNLYKAELVTASFAYLSRYDIEPFHVKMFRDILDPGDIITLADIREFNYRKLKG